jgi:hypothetical protein
MTLFAQVQVYRKGIKDLSHLGAAEPEIAWVTHEAKDGTVVVAGFAADGSTFSASGTLKDLTTKPANLGSPITQPILQGTNKVGEAPSVVTH